MDAVDTRHSRDAPRPHEDDERRAYALLLPLHDPLRVAEDIAVLDLASGGRLSPVILGLGYRPEEYAMFAKDWSNRGKLFDECVDALLKAGRASRSSSGAPPFASRRRR